MGEARYITPEYTTADEIKAIRKMLGLTQKEFAQLICSSKASVERWERSEGTITGPVVLLLKMLERYPQYVKELEVPEPELSLRLWYMHEQKVCTIIDVDERNRKIQIKNYTENVFFRAFGQDAYPSYEAYEEFLESRCFPRSRDKMKLVLKDLNLPFYDPFMIIEKTEGRMAEDHFWIKIERIADDRSI